MSVTKRQGSRNSFGSTLPVLLPLYDSASESWQFVADDEITCGAGEDCQFRLNQGGIAKRHCAFNLRAGILTVRRLDGRIWLNEIPVSTEAILAPGDIVSIGAVTISIDEIARPVSAPASAAASAPVAAPMKVTAANVPATTNYSDSVIHSVAVSPQPVFQFAPVAASVPFQFAPAIPVSPPPLPAAFFEDHSAKISAAAESLFKDRATELESRERLQLSREQQLGELELLIRDRERICLDRQSTLDERVQVLNEQKNHIEEQRTQAEAVREHLHQQKLDLQRRLRQQTEREDEIAAQFESAAHGYAKIEQTRAELSARLNDIQHREAQLEQQRREQEELASWISSQKTELQASTTAVEYRTAELHSREVALQDTVADLEKLQKALTTIEDACREREDALREREDALAMGEQRIAEARVQMNAAQTQSLDASGRMADAESIRVVAEEKLRSAEQQIQQAVEQFGLLEQSRDELARQRSELETLQQESQARYDQAVQLEEQLTTRAADIDKQQTRLAQAQQELGTRRQELNLQQADLTTQISVLEHRVNELNQREAALSVRVTQLPEESSAGTRSVEQLTAISAEKESAIRLHQEAEQAMEELKAAKAAFADREQGLNSRHAEIEARSAELADRVLRLKAERDAIRIKEQQLLDSSSKAEADVAAAQEQHQRLLERQAALTEIESRAIERESAASVVLRNAAAERDALQMSHKDLICERNALMQFSQDLNSRASGLAERESTVAQQTEELRSRFLAMNQQSSELQRLENELNLRAAELHRRVLQFKSELRDRKAPAVTAAVMAAVTEIPADQSAPDHSTGIESIREQELSEALQALESQLQGVQAERDALLTAVRELQRAMLDARADVEEANRLRTESSSQEQTLTTLYQTIEERSGQLQLLESRLRQAESHSESLERQLETYQSGGTETAAGTAVNFGDGRSESGEVEAELMRQLEALKAELKSGGETPSRNDDSNVALREQDRLIEELRLQNEALEVRISELISKIDDRNTPVSMTQVDELQAQLNRATEIISDRDDLIRELRMRLSQQVEQSGGSSASENKDVAELQREARELDRRASLLDAREEEVRERLRMVANSEEEVEKQRRQLLDARQQLELARTEIQVAMKQHSAAANYAEESELSIRRGNEEIAHESLRPGGAIFGMEAEPVSLETDEGSESSASAAVDLRAELASLFGLSGRNAEKPAQELFSTREAPDTSEPLGAAKPVALHFGEDASRIVSGHVEEPTPDSSAIAAGEDSSDDFVRDYMEQLLSRSRKSAGNSLPSELSGGGKSKSSGSSSAPAVPKKSEAAVTKSPPKVKSYIDQYMAGGSMPLEDNAASDSGEANSAGSAEHSDDTPMVPRVKVDVEKLRQNMDSFRSVSTHSVEKALVTHALRTERLSINGRIFLVCVMGFMSIFLAIANYKGIINSSVLIWVTLVGAIGAGLELTRKMYAVKSKGKALVRCEESCAGKLGSGARVDGAAKPHDGSSSKMMAPEPPPLPLAPSAIPGEVSADNGPRISAMSPYAAIAAVTAAEEMETLPQSPSR